MGRGAQSVGAAGALQGVLAMTPRAWFFSFLFAGILWVLIGVALAVIASVVLR